MDLSNFTLYKTAWMNSSNPHKSFKIDKHFADMLFSGGGYLVRNTFNWDKETTSSFWYVIKDSYNGLSDIPSKYRGRVKKALDNFEIKIISKDQMLESGLEVWQKACEHYKVKASIPTRESFEKTIMDLDDSYELWGCYHKESERMAAFAINKVFEEYVDYKTMKYHPDFLAKYHPSYGLIFMMNKYYIEEKGFLYVLDGARSITDHSDIQPFLIQKFNFRKAYCDLQLFYKPWLAIAIKLLFPLRRIVTNKKMVALLKQEAWARGEEY